MQSLTRKLSDIVGAVFEAQGFEFAQGAVRVADRPDLAQFQCNGAMASAKKAGKNPREVAQTIVATLSSMTAFSKIDIAGPGFINLSITDA